MIPGAERSPGEGNGNPFQYSCWEIPWTEEPGRLQSKGLQRVGHDLVIKQQHIFSVLEDRDPRLRCQQVWFLPKTSLLGFQVGPFSLCLQVVIAVCVHVSRGFPGGSEVKNSPANAGDTGSIPGLGRSPRVANGNPLQYSCWENSMDRGDWQAIANGVEKSQT